MIDFVLDDYVLNYILLFILLEFIEISWQKAPSIMSMLLRMNKYYSKSIFVFLFMHPTFYFAVGFVMLTGYAPAAIIILLIKTADIATKILLLQQVFTKRKLSQDLSLILLAPINAFLPYMGLIFYPILIYMSL